MVTRNAKSLPEKDGFYKTGLLPNCLLTLSDDWGIGLSKNEISNIRRELISLHVVQGSLRAVLIS